MYRGMLPSSLTPIRPRRRRPLVQGSLPAGRETVRDGEPGQLVPEREAGAVGLGSDGSRLSRNAGG